MSEPNPTGRRSEKEIFFEAIEKYTPAERAAFLDGACGNDPLLRQRVEELLAKHFQPDSFMQEPAVEGPTPMQSPIPRDEFLGTVIDKYKLLEKLGEGGFGVVYMAEQKQPIKRRVALKIIKVGMDTREVVARFETERQALAVMDHPNIARVHDAGATETGRPYFVMELVRGIKITDYCDEKNLSTRERLDLFGKVCEAVQHAHQKGIIHRDLKPSNILVTVNDGVAVPKIIDFGIAKATQLELTEKTVFTRFHQFLGTPAYMSPEQAEMTSLDIDTRSDIYSLGVLLYELLTGKTPFDANELLKAGLDEMRRTIREQEPQRPSTRVSALRGDELTTTAKRRGLDSPKLINVLRGDLDWIVMKCLEKDRARRYETANGLATDIQRHLHNEPVLACPPSNLYRLRKMVHRNKLAFAAATAVAAALLIGFGFSTWMFVNENAARQRAVAAEKKAKTQAQFFKDMLESVGPSVAKGRDKTMLLEILEKTTGRLSKDLKDQPETEVDLRNTIGGVYCALGQYEMAEAMFREALALATNRLGSEHLEVATSLGNLAAALMLQAKLAEAETMFRDGLRRLRKQLGSEHLDVATSLDNLANVLTDEGKLTEAENMSREALAMRRKLLGNEHPDVALSLNNLATTLRSQGKLAEAETMHRKALTMQRKLLGNEHPDLAASLDNLANVLRDEDKLTEAETTHREALTMQRKLLDNEHPDLATSLNNLANVLRDEGKLTEAENMNREALAMRRKLLGNEHPEVFISLNSLALTLQCQGKLAEAESLLREALVGSRKLAATQPSHENSSLGVMLHHLADVLRERLALAEARSLAEEAAAMYERHPDWPTRERIHSSRVLRAVLTDLGDFAALEELGRLELQSVRAQLPPDELQLASALAELTTTLLTNGKFTNAEPLARECLVIREKKLPDDWRTFNAQSLLGGSLLGQKKYAEAEPLLVSGYEGLNHREAKIPTIWKIRLSEAAHRLVLLYEATSRPDQAAEWKQREAIDQAANDRSKPK